MIHIGMGTSCVYPLPIDDAFAMATRVGFDGVEVMVTHDESTQDAARLLELSEKHSLPILSIHAPVLLLTAFVWGRDPHVKLRKSAELARDVGASTVVVHPPFRWQNGYADAFLHTVRILSAEYGIEIAVENMFPWKIRGRGVRAYSPSWDPSAMDCDFSTLDFSHAALSGKDAMRQALDLGPRLRHVHLCDGSRSSDEGRVFDEHLLPGHGSQPVGDVLEMLANQSWSGSIIAEVNTRKSRNDAERMSMLTETLDFARNHTSGNLALSQTGSAQTEAATMRATAFEKARPST